MEEEETPYDVEKLRREEFSRLQGTVYLDNGGAPLYAESAVRRHADLLCSEVLGNPHSASASSARSTALVDAARRRLLDELGTSDRDYSVVFTAGCTAALNLLCQSFPWTSATTGSSGSGASCGSDGRSSSTDGGGGGGARGNVLAYLDDNHTSVVGMRGAAWRRGARAACFSAADVERSGNVRELLEHAETVHPRCSHLHVGIDAEVEASARQGSSQAVPDAHRKSCPECNAAGSEPSSSGSDAVAGSALPLPRRCLVAYPLQSNFSGAKYPAARWTGLIQSPAFSRTGVTPNPAGSSDTGDSAAAAAAAAQASGNGKDSCSSVRCHVVLDISGAVGTSRVNLSAAAGDCQQQQQQPHFVVVSLYKWLGYPTGVGALLVHRDVADVLTPGFFGGGAVAAYSPHVDFAEPRPSVAERLEHGTMSFLALAALPVGFDVLFSWVRDMAAVEKHTFGLARLAYLRLTALRHGNGQPVATVYSPTAYESSDCQGPVVTFNLLRADASYVGYNQVEMAATEHGIHLRTGCFCNMGACQRWLDTSTDQLRRDWMSGHQCNDNMDIIDGRPTGAVRISFGYMSTHADVLVFIEFVESRFCESESTVRPSPVEGGVEVSKHSEEKQYELTSLMLYPIKSCAPFEVEEWEIGPSGFLYDRNWLVMTPTNAVLSQKQCSAMCRVRPTVDRQRSLLVVHSDGHAPLEVPLHTDRGSVDVRMGAIATRICGASVCGWHCGEEAAAWFTRVLARDCYLMQQDTADFSRTMSGVGGDVQDGVPVSFVNVAPFLCVNQASVRDLLRQLQESSPTEFSDVDADQLQCRFRGNLIVAGSSACEEERWKTVRIRDLTFKSAGPCSRCQMVNIDQGTGERSQEPIRTISRTQDKRLPTFGVYLYCSTYVHGRNAPPSALALRVGDQLHITE